MYVLGLLVSVSRDDLVDEIWFEATAWAFIGVSFTLLWWPIHQTRQHCPHSSWR